MEIKKVLIKKYWDWEFEPFEIDPKAKMFQHQRTSSIFIVDDTPDNRNLMALHNSAIREMNKQSEEARRISKLMKS